MKWKAPWLGKRKKVLVAGTAEIVIAFITFTVVYRLWFGEWKVGDQEVLGVASMWTFTSYLLGRYQEDRKASRERSYESYLKDIARVCGVGILTLLGIASLSWLEGEMQGGPKQPLFALVYVLLLVVCCGVIDVYFRARSRDCSREVEMIILSNEERQICRKWIERVKVANGGRFLVFSDTDPDSIISRFSWGDVNKVIVGKDVWLNQKLRTLIVDAKAGSVSVLDVMEWMESNWGVVPLGLICEKWLTSSQGFQISRHGTESKIKRIGDIAMSTALLIVSFPLIVVSAALVFAEDRGSPFYVQARTGKEGRLIRIIKLRTMAINAEAKGIQWATRNDKRVTNIGRFLRKTRIDELPQLVNVLKGELSLIGPRPERPEIEEIIESKIPYYALRRCIRPGLSGWAQVSYPYGNSVEDSRAKLEYDLFYIQYGGLWLDLLIILKTIRTVIGTGEVTGI